jgi:hypothetical protein
MIDDSMLLRIRKKNALQGRSSEVDHTHDACRVTKRSIYITSLGFYQDAMRDPLVWAAVFSHESALRKARSIGTSSNDVG